jgi:COP9 signalosome complex subunit 3
VQLAAFKKHALASVLLHGRHVAPRHAAGIVARAAKAHCAAYTDFARAFETLDHAKIDAELAKHADVFSRDGNLGLARQCVAHLQRLAILQLTRTYLTLSLVDIARQARLAPAADASDAQLAQLAETQLLAMVARGMIRCRISHATGMVSFLDAAPRAPEGLQATLKEALLLNARVAQLGREVGRSKEYLARAVAADHRGMGGLASAVGAEDELSAGIE